MALPLNVFKTVNHIATTGAVGIYTAPTGYTGVVLLAQAANVDTSSHDITFSHKRGGTTTELMNEVAIPPSDALSMVSGRLVLESGDSIVVSASSASNVKITVSILETLN